MAETLAFAASVIAVIQIAERVVDICKFYIETVKDTPSDLRLILVEISTLRPIFENVNFLTSCPNEVSTILGTLSGPNSPIVGCQLSFCKLEKLFPSNTARSNGPNHGKKQKTKATLAALAWPLKQNKARKLLGEISSYKSTITFALTADNMCDIKNIKTQTSGIHRMLTENQRQDVFTWLQHTDPSPLHHQAQKNFEDGTGNWVLRLPQWSDWLDSKQRCLWLHGLPGAGKTVLISYLTKQTQKHCEQSQVKKCTCVYYYCHYGHNRDETIPLLRWLLNQLYRQADVVPEDVYKIYKRGGQPDLMELLSAIADILGEFETIFVIVDAIDESNPRENLLKVLRDLVTDSRFQKVQLLASSREYIDIERIMHPISIPVSMANPFVGEDIRVHVRSVLLSNPNFRRWPSELLTEIENTVSKGAKGMFRWAVCQIDVLQRLKAEDNIVREALANLPKTLDETYDRILLMVPEEEQLFVQHALQWIRYHGELHHGKGIPCNILVQAVTKSTAGHGVNLNSRYYDLEVIRELCGCLVKVVPQKIKREICESEYGDRCEYEHTTLEVSFAHFTVQEYLDSSRISKSSTDLSVACKESQWQNFTATVFKEACQAKMNELWQRSKPEEHARDAFLAMDNDFYAYSITSAISSCRKWMAKIIRHDELRTLIYEFLNPTKHHHKSARTILNFLDESIDYHNEIDFDQRIWDTNWDYESSDAYAMLLHNLLHMTERTSEQLLLVRYFMEGKDVGSLLQVSMKFKKKMWFESSLHDYSFNGRLIEILAALPTVDNLTVELLLNYDTKISNPSSLLFAYLGRHIYDNADSCKEKCLVEHLLEGGADPNNLDYRVTPLQVATVSWDLEGVEALLRAGADPNCTGNCNGVVGEKYAFIHRFDYLSGASPLHICRHFESILEPYVEDDRRGEREELEGMLLEYGALDFRENVSAESF